MKSAQSAFDVRTLDRWLQRQFGGDTSDTVMEGDRVCYLLSIHYVPYEYYMQYSLTLGPLAICMQRRSMSSRSERSQAAGPTRTLEQLCLSPRAVEPLEDTCELYTDSFTSR